MNDVLVDPLPLRDFGDGADTLGLELASRRKQVGIEGRSGLVGGTATWHQDVLHVARSLSGEWIVHDRESRALISRERKAASLWTQVLVGPGLVSVHRFENKGATPIRMRPFGDQRRIAFGAAYEKNSSKATVSRMRAQNSEILPSGRGGRPPPHVGRSVFHLACDPSGHA